MTSAPETHPVEVRRLNKRYRDGTWANRDLSLTVGRGELLTILGPNGAGKTTLVRQITTELRPTSGEVQVMGINALSEPSRVKVMLGVIPQEATLFAGLSVWHHLRVFARMRGLSRKDARARAEEVIEALRLGEHRNKTAQDLSGGLRRRVLVGLAVLAHPPLLVLDEPTTGLDVQSRRDLWSLLRQYKAQGTAVLLTTHYMEEAEALSDRVGIIDDGRLLALDTVENLRAAQGFEFKVTFGPSSGEAEIIYGKDGQELAERARAMAAEEFEVSRANLEDVYLALTGGDRTLDDTAF